MAGRPPVTPVTRGSHSGNGRETGRCQAAVIHRGARVPQRRRPYHRARECARDTPKDEGP
nr:hypothetical protein StreXyl84_46160 [Streptomyces sp. Xyl84]